MTLTTDLDTGPLHILASVVKQYWGGHKKDTAIEIETVDVDVSGALAKLDYIRMVGLEDHRDSTDALIDPAAIGHQGMPFEVSVTLRLCEALGFESLEEIPYATWERTRDRLNAAADELRPMPVEVAEPEEGTSFRP